MAVSTEPRIYENVSLRQLWFGVSAGPVLWALYHMLAYGVSSMVCKWGWLGFDLAGIPAARLTMAAMTIVFAAVVAYAGFLSFGLWQRLRGQRDERPEQRHRTEEERSTEPAGRFRFMALSGALLSGLFALTILVSLAPIILLDLCATQ
jgi:hypothetical protein